VKLKDEFNVENGGACNGVCRWASPSYIPTLLCAPRAKLDPSYYHLRPDELAFFQRLTGIDDESVLKQHILRVQAKAYEVSAGRFR